MDSLYWLIYDYLFCCSTSNPLSNSNDEFIHVYSYILTHCDTQIDANAG